MSFTFHGKEVASHVISEARFAVEETLHEAAEEAKRSHWWTKRRAAGLETQIQVGPIEHVGSVIRGTFGATKGQGFYGLFLERRVPYLRPAADATFPKLAVKLRNRLRW